MFSSTPLLVPSPLPSRAFRLMLLALSRLSLRYASPFLMCHLPSYPNKIPASRQETRNQAEGFDMEIFRRHRRGEANLDPTPPSQCLSRKSLDIRKSGCTSTGQAHSAAGGSASKINSCRRNNPPPTVPPTAIGTPTSQVAILRAWVRCSSFIVSPSLRRCSIPGFVALSSETRWPREAPPSEGFECWWRRGFWGRLLKPGCEVDGIPGGWTSPVNSASEQSGFFGPLLLHYEYYLSSEERSAHAKDWRAASSLRFSHGLVLSHGVHALLPSMHSLAEPAFFAQLGSALSCRLIACSI
ncbi:hypothetical protein KC333_g215 [Hortaea werneckii]|nr:hypothetical protein KC333_g215 [Hortaea werneckii]